MEFLDDLIFEGSSKDAYNRIEELPANDFHVQFCYSKNKGSDSNRCQDFPRNILENRSTNKRMKIRIIF